MQTPVKIDFESHLPYYIQLMDILKEHIAQADWKPDTQIPSEQELCEAYGVSRTVVRQALRELEFQGLIYRRKGKGTFVSPPKISEGLIHKLTGFHQDMVERGHTPGTHVLHQKVSAANEKVAAFLEVAPGTQVVDIRRLRFTDAEPIQLVSSYLPFDLFPGLVDVDLSNRSLYEFLESEYGVYPAHGRRYVEAVLSNEVEAELLNIKKGAPLLMLDSVIYSAADRPIEYYHAVHRGDRSRFEIELVRVDDDL